MRNPLKHLARRPDLPKAPLRARLDAAKQRLAAAKDKAGRIVAMNRIMLTKIQEPAPAVDRAALVNYATFLWHERQAVCAELYPHKGAKAAAFVIGMNEAWAFFFTGRNDATPRKDQPPASSRAVKVLDMVGIDWRRDRDAGGVIPDKGKHDTGERPAVPHNWPAPDAALVEALDDLTRIDAAISTMHDAGSDDRDGDTVPVYDGLEEARTDTLVRLATERAESLLGMQAKARALLTRCLSDQGGEPYEAIAASLARDLLGLRAHQVEPRPDPIFGVIEEARRLCAEHTAACNPDKPAHLPDPPEVVDRRDDAYEALAAFIDGTLLKTVPTTAEGCKALAHFAIDFTADQGVPLQGAADSNDPILALIARSPLL